MVVVQILLLYPAPLLIYPSRHLSLVLSGSKLAQAQSVASQDPQPTRAMTTLFPRLLYLTPTRHQASLPPFFTLNPATLSNLTLPNRKRHLQYLSRFGRLYHVFLNFVIRT